MDRSAHPNSRRAAIPGYAIDSAWDVQDDHDHVVQFYETDTFLLESLSSFVRVGLSVQEAAIIVATASHLDALQQRLAAMGIDVDSACASGQLMFLDAEDALAAFMDGGRPDPQQFTTLFGPLIERVAQHWRQVRIYGEMVALLWAEENYAAALDLEELWNTLHKDQSFVLFCGYPLESFGGDTSAIWDVCATHSRVIPAESYTSLSDADERLRTIISLQQQAHLLQAEIEERKAVEAELRVLKASLELQVEDLRRLHALSMQLTSTLDMQPIIDEVFDAALAVQNAERGLLFLCGQEGLGLRLRTQRGFDEAFLKQVQCVPVGGGACGTAYARRARVIIEDTETDPLFAAFRDVARRAGFRAIHSTPLITRNGAIIGVLSTHFATPHRPSDRETRLMDLYAQIAADCIESARLHQQVQDELALREQILLREQAARQEAELANRLKDEFLAAVSHELRTPLTTIIGWAQRLRLRRRDEATFERGLGFIEQYAKLQARIIDDLLDFSQMSAGTLTLNIDVVDLAAIINAAVDSVQQAADAKGVQLAIFIERSARHVLGDAGRLQQILWNVLSNAIKFTPAGGQVEVYLERAESKVQIRICDTGEGIPAAFLPHLFDRFRQADGTSTRSHGGLGLGLSIVRQLVELHGGTIQAESPGLGCGATFTICLPSTPKRESASPTH